jgi:predicted transcriptional regulator
MQTKPNKKILKSKPSIEKKADHKILSLFPSLCFWNFTNSQNEKRIALQHLACLNKVGRKGSISASELSQELNISRSEAIKEIKKLVSQSFLKSNKKEKTVSYTLTTLGFVALISFEEFQEWTKIKSILCVPQKKSDALAYALLVIGFCANETDSVYQALSKYAAQGHTLELVKTEVIAESLLSFYRQELRASTNTAPNYLNVFKEFTTTGFQDVFRMLLLAIKPTPEDYSGLIEFFNEVAEFYFDPARIAFVNLLTENQNMRQRLDEFKKAQDMQIKKEGSTLEVTFTIPKSGISKIDTMPPHLRAMGMRLILEPVKFINQELWSYFWT